MCIYNLKVVKSVLVKYVVVLLNFVYIVLLKILIRSEYVLFISFNLYGLDVCLIVNCKNMFILIVLVFGFIYVLENGNDNVCFCCEFVLERFELNE